MAKNAVTPEVIESIMVKITDKFTDVLNTIMNQFSVMLTNTVNAQLAVINSRLDNIEAQLANQSASAAQPNHTGADESSLNSVVEATSRILVEMEREKEAKKLKARNVIISGLQVRSDVCDTELVESFCEQYLTVKPHVVRTRRVGNNPNSSTMRLCVTLNSEETAHDLLESATILRRSPDITARQVYINPDLTKAQANEAYKRRCEKRAQRASTSTTSSASLSASAPPFQLSQ